MESKWIILKLIMEKGLKPIFISKRHQTSHLVFTHLLLKFDPKTQSRKTLNYRSRAAPPSPCRISLAPSSSILHPSSSRYIFIFIFSFFSLFLEKNHCLMLVKIEYNESRRTCLIFINYVYTWVLTTIHLVFNSLIASDVFKIGKLSLKLGFLIYLFLFQLQCLICCGQYV